MDDQNKSAPVIVFSSKGGGGHVAASEALREALEGDFKIEVYNALTDVFGRVDFLSKISSTKFTAEDFYNFVLKRRLFRLVNFYGQLGKAYMRWNKETLIQAAREFLLLKKPKMIISVIPFFNGAIYEACLELNIPFWIIPTDVELKTFLIGLHISSTQNPLFKLALAYPSQIKQAQICGISKKQIIPVGFPVKKACNHAYLPSDIAQLKKQLHVNEDTRVITLTLGATGTSLFYKLSKELINLGHTDLEFNCCAGKDTKSYMKVITLLEKIALLEYADGLQKIYRLASGNRLHLWGFTSYLSQLMAISDLIISKTGSLSVSEALYLNKYLLLDHTLNSSSRLLSWEKANLPFVRSLQQGEGFYSKKDLVSKIESFLNAPRERYLTESFLNIHQILPEAVKGQVG